MFDEARRTLRFLRKAWRAGLIPVRLGTMPVSEIRYWSETGWLEEYMAGTAHNVYATPHYQLLTAPSWSFHHATPYWQWQVSMKGYQHSRSDAWIRAMGNRLLRIYEEIRDGGYHHRCLGDRIAVFEDGRIWDGGHRLACLAALGWMRVPVVWMRRLPWV